MTDRGTTRLRARALLRFVGAVLATTGALLLAEVAATLLWQEPISALIAARGQNELESQLATVSRRFARAADSPAAVRPRPRFEPAQAARAFAAMLRKGRAFGRIEMPTLERSFFMAEGTDTATLRKGAGHYPSTAMPGQGRTVAVAGGRTTYGAPFAEPRRAATGRADQDHDAVRALHVPRGRTPDRRAHRVESDSERGA
jgi:sortase A